MAEVIRLSPGQLADEDLDRLFGQAYWYPGAAAMRERLGAVELYGYRRDQLDGLVGIMTEGGQSRLEPWTPAVAADIADGGAVARILLEAVQRAGPSLLSVLRDRDGSRARTQACWLRSAGFGDVTVRAAMATDLVQPPSVPDRASLAWETVTDPEDLAELAEACYAGGPDPVAADRGAEGWRQRMRQVREGRMGTYLPELSGLLRVEGRPAGFFLGTERGPAARFPSGWAYLADIGVVAERRRQGLGATLLAQFLARACEGGRDGAWLLVDDLNTPARALYQAFGFRLLEVVTVGRWEAARQVGPVPGTERSEHPPG